ncbi:unnamed protein product [Microthlaspi erraticum]|uniref:Uncharacterized protein n=1 Tax=Microthlaspi erraticum TaxID=1685480 RepID=A0A6D2HNC8_9BRAS|nr:unnamed protein product [Microthlaspi erraticum]
MADGTVFKLGTESTSNTFSFSLLPCSSPLLCPREAMAGNAAAETAAKTVTTAFQHPWRAKLDKYRTEECMVTGRWGCGNSFILSGG